MSFKKFIILAIGCAFLSACASSAMKNRKEQQLKLSQSSKLYCDFINGSLYHDVEVVLNLEIAKRCDSEKPFTMTQFKTQSDDNGVLYCCTLISAKTAVRAKSPEKPVEKNYDRPSEKPAEKPVDKRDEKKVEEEII